MHDVIQAPTAICGQSVLAAAALATQAYVDVVIDGRAYPLSGVFYFYSSDWREEDRC